MSESRMGTKHPWNKAYGVPVSRECRRAGARLGVGLLLALFWLLSPARVLGQGVSLDFIADPNGSYSAGQVMLNGSTNPLQVAVLDGSGGIEIGDNSTVITVAIKAGTGAPGATLFGTTSQQVVQGVAYFSNLSIQTASGTPYVLTATSVPSFGTADSTSFFIFAGSADHLGFSPIPNAQAGAAIAPPFSVAFLDQYNNVVTFSESSITVSIGNNPGGGVLSGTTTQFVSGGIATFNDISINKTGNGYTLNATDGQLGGSSGSFNITPGAASKVSFTVQPPNSTGGTPFSTSPQVTVLDANDNVVTSSSASITVAIGTNPSGGTLSGTTTLSASAGVANFTGLSIDRAGIGYTLTAASAGLTGATSALFDIAVGAATRLAFSAQPTTTSAGAIFSIVSVAVQDAGGNDVTAGSHSITVAIGNNPGGGTLSGTTTVASVRGISDFTTLSINKTANGYTLTAAASGLTGTTSTAFNILPGTPTQLAFTVQPSSTNAAVAISPAVQVTVQDANANTVTGSGSSITVAIGNNPGGGTLSGTTTVAASNGIATFSNLSINNSGNGYTLTAASLQLTGATSTPFNILGTDLSLSKTHIGNFTGGSNGVYTLTVTNLSAVPTSSATTVSDTLPSGLVFVSATGTGWSCSASGQTVTCVRASAIPAGGTAVITLTVSIPAATAGALTNNATVSNADDNVAFNNGASDTTIINRQGSTGTYSFTPTSRTIVINNANVTVDVFTVLLLSNVSGTIVDVETGSPIAGITVNLCAGAGGCSTPQASPVTNASGFFLATGVPNGAYTVTPASSTTPPSQAITVSGADVTGVNFTFP